MADETSANWSNIDYPSSFSNLNYFYKALKKEGEEKSKKEIKKLLEENAVYQTSRALKKTFPRRKDETFYFSKRWEGDLGDIGENRFKSVKHGNKKGRYFLLLIDIFSKKIFAEALQKKDAGVVLKAFEKIIDSLQPPYTAPEELETDFGGEFRNKILESYLKKHGVRWKVAVGQNKARHAERAIRSFKKVLIPYIENNLNVTWPEAIEKVTKNLNGRFNRTIRMSPDEVTEKYEELQQRLIDEAEKNRMKFKDFYEEQNKIRAGERVQDGNESFGLGDEVFIPQKNKSVLGKKESDRPYSYHIYKIVQILNEERPFLYVLEDGMGGRVKRLYYAVEMKKAKQPEYFPIKKVLKNKKGPDGKKYTLVRWMDYDSRFDEWIPSDEVK